MLLEIVYSISIPYGAIKSLFLATDLESDFAFQFLMVRLKECNS